MNSCVITGATGVIGMALIKKAIEEKTRVIVLANPDSKRLERIPVSDYVTVIPCGIAEYGDFDADRLLKELHIDRVDVFYHLSWAGTFGQARNDMELQDKNVEYTLDAVRLAGRLNCECFVGVGSQAEYGRVEGALRADTPTHPENGYGIKKLEAGIRSRQLAGRLGIRHIWTRVLSIYGPYDGTGTMVMSTIDNLVNGIEPSLTKGEQLWDYLYSADAADALYRIGLYGVDGRIYPIGSGKARPLREYIEEIAGIVNPGVTLGFGRRPYADNQVMYLKADISQLKEDTGFEANTEFTDGIREILSVHYGIE